MKMPHHLGVALTLLAAAAAHGQTLFTQDFSSSSTLSNYIGSGSGQFDAISPGTPNTATITGGALTLNKTSNNSAAIARTTNLPTSSALLVQFDFSISGNSVVQNSSNAQSNNSTVSFYLGSGLSTSTTGETNSSVTARFNIGWTATSGQWNLLSSSGTASANQSGSQTISWYVNNGSSNVSYTGPDAGSYSVAAGTYDLWIGSTRSFSGTAVTTTGLDATDLKFRWGASAANGTATFDNIAVSAIPEPSTYAALLGAAALVGAFWMRRERSS